MELLVTLVLRLISFRTEVHNKAIELLYTMRKITFDWILQLREKLHSTTDTASFRNLSEQTFWASIVCRSTFSIHVDPAYVLDSMNLGMYIVSSVTMQDNLTLDPLTFPTGLRCAMIKDLKLAYNLRFCLQESVQDCSTSLASTMDLILPNGENSSTRKVVDVNFSDHSDQWVVQLTLETAGELLEIVHFDLLEGHFFVAGKPIGKLPAEYKQTELLSKLFGDQNLPVYPSMLPGMDYRLASRVKDHEVHLGFRRGDLIVRTRFGNRTLELIPIERFFNAQSFDLPGELLFNNTHWIDLATKKLEIRPGPAFEKPRRRNWVIDSVTGKTIHQKASLVDPHSSLFKTVAEVFNHFEDPRQIMVLQPNKGPLQVRLRRLELNFFVNKSRRLECEQLRSEIDPFQDAGTWYGLRSKIILRELIGRVTAPRYRRSIIVPTGIMSVQRDDFHVAVRVENIGQYARYTINDILGRIECGAESLNLYLKAQFHAYTSFVLPDPLTTRTGTEEALHFLSSGCCQPWQPLSLRSTEPLLELARLTPRRCYYPAGMKVMQRIDWNPNLTPTIQHDGYRSLVESILAKSKELSLFTIQDDHHPELDQPGDSHLTSRSRARRQTYQKPTTESSTVDALFNVPYVARGCRDTSTEQTNVYECVRSISSWSSVLPLTTDLMTSIQSWPKIGGYIGSFDKTLLTDLLGVDFATEWGSLIKLCRDSTKADSFRLMFLFSAMSFRDDISLETARTLIAFATIDLLKKISLPYFGNFTHVKQGEKPHASHIRDLMASCLIPFTYQESNQNGKWRHDLPQQLAQHLQNQSKNNRIFVKHVIQQWPCLEPEADDLPISDTLDIEQALEAIRPEWSRLFQNLALSNHIFEVQKVLNIHRCLPSYEPHTFAFQGGAMLPSRHGGGNIPTLRNLVGLLCPPIVSAPTTIQTILPGETHKVPVARVVPRENIQEDNQIIHASIVSAPSASPCQDTLTLRGIIENLVQSDSAVRRQYGKDLIDSTVSLEKARNVSQELVLHNRDSLTQRIDNAQKLVDEVFARLVNAFDAYATGVRWLQKAQLWPSISVITLLECLRSTASHIRMGHGMRDCLISYGVAISNLQRLLRIEEADSKDHKTKLQEEMSNLGRENWKPDDHTDWLLLEIDSNIAIRPGQVDVSNATIKPDSGSNSVLQMNMGQGIISLHTSQASLANSPAGKTSVIIPMSAAILANGKNLVRVVEPKSLLLQTAQLLHARLGGLLGRELRHIPFSRRSITNSETIKTFLDIHKYIQKHSGVMIALPEHMLSFKLSGLQKLSDGKVNEGSTMVKAQNWLETNSRDILDEVDHILAIRTQLIYPSGAQKSVDGHPLRWEVVQELLKQVNSHLWNLQDEFPQSIEVVQRKQGGFPVMYFLRTDVEDELISRLVEDIMRDHTSILPKDSELSDRLLIKKFITEPKLSLELSRRIQRTLSGQVKLKKTVHLLRGLLVHRILLMALKKRWNVQYGLHPKRDPMAVPVSAPRYGMTYVSSVSLLWSKYT
jgi:hypothetical protein